MQVRFDKKAAMFYFFGNRETDRYFINNKTFRTVHTILSRTTFYDRVMFGCLFCRKELVCYTHARGWAEKDLYL